MKLGRLFKFTEVDDIHVNREGYDERHYYFERQIKHCNFEEDNRMTPLLIIVFIIALLVYSAWW